MIAHLFFILLVLGTGQSFYAEEGCEVKSKWTTDFTLPDTYISVWVPSGEGSTTIMKIEIEFEDKISLIIVDIISVYHDGIKFIKVRKGKPEVKQNETSISIADGWADFLLSVDSDYNLMYLNKETDVLNGTVDYPPKSFLITGSNVTLYCPSKLRRWTISENLVSIPLDGVEKHRLTFYSTKEFLPTIILEGRNFKLGWNSSHLTTIPNEAKPLPPFVQHNVTFTCQKHQKTVCTMKIGEEMEEAERMHFRDLPMSVSIKGNPGDDFFVFLHQDDPISILTTVRTNVSETAERFPSISEDSSHGFFVPFMVTLMFLILLILVGVIYYIYWKCRTPQEKELRGGQSRRERTQTASTASLLGNQNRDSAVILLQFPKAQEKNLEKILGTREGTQPALMAPLLENRDHTAAALIQENELENDGQSTEARSLASLKPAITSAGSGIEDNTIVQLEEVEKYRNFLYMDDINILKEIINNTSPQNIRKIIFKDSMMIYLSELTHFEQKH